MSTFKFGDSELTPVSEWIPCDERLPSESGFYLVNMRDISSQDEYQQVSYYLSVGWFSTSFNEKPTHWQPLPTPPKEAQ